MASANRSSRRRTGSRSTTHLEVAPEVKTPRLPATGWSNQSRRRWQQWWSSPPAAEWIPAADIHGLLTLLRLYEHLDDAENARAIIDLNREIRQVESQYGLNPASRSKLRYEVVKASEAEDRQARRRRPKAASSTDIGDGAKSVKSGDMTKEQMLARVRGAG